MKLTLAQLAEYHKEFNRIYPNMPIGLWGDEESGHYVMVVGPSDGNQVQMIAIANAMLASAIVQKVNEVVLLDMATPKETM